MPGQWRRSGHFVGKNLLQSVDYGKAANNCPLTNFYFTKAVERKRPHGNAASCKIQYPMKNLRYYNKPRTRLFLRLN